MIYARILKFLLAKAAWALSSALRRSRRFCVKWAELHSAEYEFEERREAAWEQPWRVEFYDLHRWAGERIHWNSHDVESGKGGTPAGAWSDMARRIVEYENASSEEEALLKAELKLRRSMPRGWGRQEYNAYFGIKAF